jgi:peptide/nickel transport system substrate-binding protein
VEIKAVKDENTCFLKLQKGEVDITQNAVSLDRLQKLSQDYPQLKVVNRPGLNTSYIGFNTEDPILRHKLGRQAIDLAIDRSAIIKYLLKEMAIPARTIVLPHDPYYNGELPPLEFNHAKAKALLDQAGFKPAANGVRFTLTYKTSNNATRTAIAKAIASNLLQVGIKVTVLSLDWGKFKLDVDKGHVQMWGLSWVGFKDPDIYSYAFATANFPPHGANRGRFSQPHLDTLLAKARLTVVEAERHTLYAEVQKIIAEEAPYVFLYHEDKVAIMNKAVQGFQVYADGRYSALATAYK